MLNYKNIIEDFAKIAKEHKQINSFGTGDIRQLIYLTQQKKGVPQQNNQWGDNLTDEAPTYPLLYVLPSSVSRDEQFLTHTFNIIVCDIMNVKNYNIETDLLSDTLQMCEDVLAQFKYSVTIPQGDYELKYDIVLPAQINSFSESYDDILVGWNMTIQIVLDNPLNRCIAPFRPF